MAEVMLGKQQLPGRTEFCVDGLQFLEQHVLLEQLLADPNRHRLAE